MLTKLLVTSLLALACAGQSIPDQAPVYKLLYSPSFGSPVGYPTTMFEVEPGLFYVEGTLASGTIFTITAAGTFNLIYTFAPNTSLGSFLQGTNRRLYGSINFNGGSSFSYYSISPSGKNLQQYPLPGTWGSGQYTIAAPPGELYDVLARPGGAPNYAFARISETGKISILHQFSGSDGFPNPYANIVYGPDGNIYGISNQQEGGTGPGLIYRFTPSGVYSQLLSFPSFPGAYNEALIAASDGNLYGSFTEGGVNNTGELYQATLSGQFQTVASFPAMPRCNYGCGPVSLMQASDGNLYGSTNSNSNFIFRYNLATRQLSKVYQLSKDASQGLCYCQLIEGMDGKLYGVSPLGGNTGGNGAIFSLNIGLPRPTPVISQTYPAAGPIGQKVLLWGKYLLGATSVTFNGTPASAVVVTSVQSAYATVPVGATTGPVTITTANGSFTTTENFTVQ